MATLRRRSVSLLSGCLVALLSGNLLHLQAAPFIPKVKEATSFHDAVFGLQELRENIEGVACGGWETGSGGGGSVPIPVVSPDIPGRSNADPLATPTVGVGERGDFEFPETAFGFLTACPEILAGGEATVDQDLAALGIPGVVWSWTGNVDDPVQFLPDETRPGRIEINPFHWCVTKETSSPRLCEKLHKTLRSLADVIPRPSPLARCECPPDAIYCPPEPVEKHYCFDTPSEGTKRPDLQTSCEGQDCRTQHSASFSNELVRCEWGIRQYEDGNDVGQLPSSISGNSEGWQTTSLYRHYGNPFNDWSETREAARSPLEVTSPAGDSWKLRAECYGQYRETDPKDTVMTAESEQCEVVILSPDEGRPKKPEWTDGGGGRQRGDTAPSPASVIEPLPPSRAVPEPWVADPMTNVSLIDTAKLRSMQQSLLDPLDITSMLGTILPTRLQASGTETRGEKTDTLSDDAGRGLGKFWEREQRVLLQMIEDPVVRLVMPSRFLLGLSSDDPLFRYVLHVAPEADGIVAATLRQGPDDVTNVLLSLLRTYVGPIERVSVPILVPLLSERDIDTAIFRWRQWAEEERRFALAAGRASLDGKAVDIIAKLEAYKIRARSVRVLQASEAVILEKYLDVQREIREYVAGWFQRNGERLEQAAARSAERLELKGVWREAQDWMLKADASQLLWCSNHRFSAPVYSLLDLPAPWWGDPGSLYRNHTWKPPSLTSLPYAREPDMEFDFSDMKFSSEPVLVPKLSLIDVAVNLPLPPQPGGIPDEAATLPDLPSLPGPDLFSTLPLPSVTLPKEKLIDVPPSSPSLRPAIDMMREFSDRMRRMYDSYSRFQKSFADLPDPSQAIGNVTKIIHPENDLKERIGRAFSRWMPERNADRSARARRLLEEGFRDGPGACREGIVCSFLAPYERLSVTWQWFAPKASSEGITAKALELRQSTLPVSDANNPFRATLPSLERLFPDVSLPFSISLLIPPPSPPAP